jgi:creatinine amidohydrolase/Fe(II)-dependent formamide hydrolase-like protein
MPRAFVKIVSVSLRWLALLVLAPSLSAAQVFHVEQMNSSQMLDRQKTAVLLWGGILEAHGPYLPASTDGYINDYLTRRLAEAITARPGWVVVLRFPPVPLGTATAESIGGLRQFPGSYGVREATLRAIFVDLGSAALDAAAGHFNR